MFILGILVGRGTAPIPLKTHQLEQELKALKEAVLQKQKREIEARVKQGGDTPAAELGFYEALKKPASQVRKPSPSKPDARPVKPVKPKPVDPKPVTPKPVAPKPVAAKPAPTARAAQSVQKRFTIQVGSFKETGSADRMVSRLRSKGHAAYQLRTEVPGKGVWYRVRVGAFDSRAAAQSMIARLKGQKIEGMVVGTP